MNPAPKQPPKQPPERPRGSIVKLPDRPDRPSPHGVQWWVCGRRKREFFRTTAARDTRYADLLRAARRGEIAEEMSRPEIAQWRAFSAAIEGTPWQDVVAGWREHLRASGRAPCLKTVAEAAKEFLAAAEQRQKDPKESTSDGYFRHIQKKIQMFSDAFGANRLSAVTAEDIERWVDDLGFEANGTFNSYVKKVRAFFAHFDREVANPCDRIELRDESVDEVEILTPDQAATLFSYALRHHRDALGRLALEAFCGLRFSSAFRLEKKDINFEDRGITLPAHKHKVGRRFYIDGLPDNAWSWLAATNDGCWAMEGSEWMHLKSRLFTDAGVPHPRNCLRHSFCTYHVAALKNPGLTATILTHRDQQKLWERYNGRATQAEGRRYFGIVP